MGAEVKMKKKERWNKELVQTLGKILAYHISVLSVDIDQLPIHGSPRVTAYCLCMAIFTKGLYRLRFPSLFGIL